MEQVVRKSCESENYPAVLPPSTSATSISNLRISKTKFYHSAAVLPQEVASQLPDLIPTPPLVNPYKTPKDRLITLYLLNDCQALVSLPLMGDHKPCHWMNRMFALLPDNYKPDFIVRSLLLCPLPPAAGEGIRPSCSSLEG